MFFSLLSPISLHFLLPSLFTSSSFTLHSSLFTLHFLLPPLFTLHFLLPPLFTLRSSLNSHLDAYCANEIRTFTPARVLVIGADVEI